MNYLDGRPSSKANSWALFQSKKSLCRWVCYWCEFVGRNRSGFFREKDSAYDGYLVLFLLACTARLAAFFFLGKQPEPPQADPQPLPPLSTYLSRPFQNKNYRRILAFYLALLFPVGISAPYFSAHLIKVLEWDFRLVAATSIGTSIVSLIVEPIWGKLVDRHGHRPVLILCTIGITHLPIYYAFGPYDLYWPFFANALLA